MTKLLTAKRLVATAATAALGAGALVGLTATSAGAATLATNYTCTFPNLGAQQIPVSVTAELPPAADAGTEVPALPLQMTATIPAQVVGAAKVGFGATSIGGRSDDMDATLNDAANVAAVKTRLTNVVFQEQQLPATPAPVTLSTPAVTSVTPVPAATTAFDLPASGAYSVNLPNTFTFAAALGTPNGTTTLQVPCALTAGSATKVADLAVEAAEADITAKAPKKAVKPGKAKLKVTVGSEGLVPTGKVTVMAGKKVVGKATLNAKGKANVKLKKIKKVGVTKVKVMYAGDDFTDAAKSKKIKIKIG